MNKQIIETGSFEEYTFAFYNTFDNVMTVFDDQSHDGSGPFLVGQVTDPENTKEFEVQVFTEYREARLKFFELCNGEFDCVIDPLDQPGQAVRARV